MSNLPSGSRDLLAQAVEGLSPSAAAKARARAQLAALGPPTLERSHDPDDISPREALEQPLSDSTAPPPSVRAAALVLVGAMVGGLGGFALGSRYSHSSEAGREATTLSVPGVTASVVEHERALSSHLKPPQPPKQSVTQAPPKTEAAGHSTKHKSPLEGADGGRGKTETVGDKPSTATEEDEVTWVQRVRKALARGEAQLALGLLRELDVKIPQGRLAEERAAGRAIARCMLQSPDRLKEAQSFSARYPNSVHRERVELTCAGLSKTTSPSRAKSKP